MELRSQTANILSIARVPLAGAFLLVYRGDDVAGFAEGLGIAVAALITDIADGRIARQLGITSDLGALLDGFGDKTFYVAVYLVIVLERPTVSFLLWLLIIREILLYGLRILDDRRGETTRSLRWISQGHAVFIRIYFFAVLYHDGAVLFRYPLSPVLRYDFLFADGALVLGFIGLFQMVRRLGEQSPAKSNHGR